MAPLGSNTQLIQEMICSGFSPLFYIHWWHLDQISTKDTPVHKSYQTHLTSSLHCDVKLCSLIRANFNSLEENGFLSHFQLLAKLAYSNFKTNNNNKNKKNNPVHCGLHQFPRCPRADPIINFPFCIYSGSDLIQF